MNPLELLKKSLVVLRENGFAYTKSRIGEYLRRTHKLRRIKLPLDIPPAERTRQSGAVFARPVTFSVLVPLYNTPPAFLRELIASVRRQTYPHWQLCLADGSDAAHPEPEAICRALALEDPRIRYRKLEKNEGISENSNRCIEMSDGEYLSLLDHDDLLHPSALYEVMRVIAEQGADFIYTDEMTFQRKTLSGRFVRPVSIHLKPDFCPDNLRANNYICHFTTFRRTLLDQAGTFRKAFDGSQDHDLFLRLTETARTVAHIPQVLYFWRSHRHSMAKNTKSKPYCIEAGRQAVAAQLDRLGLSGRVSEIEKPGSIYRIQYALRGTPLVSILAYGASKPQEDDLLRGNTYPAVSVHGCAYADLNRAAREASGAYLLLLDARCAALAPGWLEELLMFAQRPDVGAVGAKLLYPDDTIASSGIVLGLFGSAGPAHHGESRVNYGYMGRLCYAQEVTAVSGRCLLVRRDRFLDCGGIDLSYHQDFWDVELCLRLRDAGYRNIFTPFALLRYQGPHWQGRHGRDKTLLPADEELFRQRWQARIQQGDPCWREGPPSLSGVVLG